MVGACCYFAMSAMQEALQEDGSGGVDHISSMSLDMLRQILAMLAVRDR